MAGAYDAGWSITRPSLSIRAGRFKEFRVDDIVKDHGAAAAERALGGGDNLDRFLYGNRIPGWIRFQEFPAAREFGGAGAIAEQP